MILRVQARLLGSQFSEDFIFRKSPWQVLPETRLAASAVPAWGQNIPVDGDDGCLVVMWRRETLLQMWYTHRRSMKLNVAGIHPTKKCTTEMFHLHVNWS